MTERDAGTEDRWLRGALGAQAAYFVATGIWPFLHRRSFEAITGRKHDYWLVQTVGALVAVVGVVLARAALANPDGRRPAGVELAVGSAAALATVEAWYAAKRRISWVYAADALAEVAFVAAVLRGARRESAA